jgi:hypothetical protein
MAKMITARSKIGAELDVVVVVAAAVQLNATILFTIGVIQSKENDRATCIMA